jgi:hypothetical protein
LAFRNFKATRQRLLGGLFFSSSSLCLIFSVAFLGCLPFQKRMTPAQIEQQRAQGAAVVKAQVARQLAPRDALADATMLDLSPFYNRELRFLKNLPDFRTITPGTHSWNGVKFDVRAEIEVSWGMPKGLKGIPVNRKCAELYFLHGLEWSMPSNMVSQFVIHFTGTNTVILPMMEGRDVASESFPQNQNYAAQMPTNMVVFLERIYTNAPPQPWRVFFISRWVNPTPDQSVETIDFLPGHVGDTPFLVAITLKPAGSERK